MRALLLFAILLAPLTAAQVPSAAFEMTAEGPEILPPMASSSYSLTVTVGCMEVLENSGEADVIVSALELPEGITAESVEMHFGIEDCLGEEAITQTTTINLVVAANAHGLEPFTVTFEAALGDHTTEAQVPDVMVDYLPGHTMTPAGDQVFEVDGPTYAFDLILNFTSNAKTMVMFEDKVVSGAAILTGLKAQIVDVETTKSVTNNIVFTAPEGAWTEETVTFNTYSHGLDGPDCGENFEQNITWTFRNADPNVSANDGPVDEEAPGLALPIVLAALAGLAIARRRL